MIAIDGLDALQLRQTEFRVLQRFPRIRVAEVADAVWGAAGVRRRSVNFPSAANRGLIATVSFSRGSRRRAYPRSGPGSRHEEFATRNGPTISLAFETRPSASVTQPSNSARLACCAAALDEAAAKARTRTMRFI